MIQRCVHIQNGNEFAIQKSSVDSNKMNWSRGLRVQTVIWFLVIENCIDTNQICIWLYESTAHGNCNRFAIRI